MGLTTKISDAITGKRERCFLSDDTNSVLLNVVVDDSEIHPIDITNHAIEDGSDISDSTWQRPLQMSLNCVLTDSISDIISGWSEMSLTSMEDRKKILKTWMDDKTVLTFYSWDTTYKNMLIENIDYRRSLETGNGMGMELTLKQVNIAESQVAQVGLTQSTDKGKQATKTQTKTETRRSMLKSLSNTLETLLKGI